MDGGGGVKSRQTCVICVTCVQTISGLVNLVTQPDATGLAGDANQPEASHVYRTAV